MPGRQFLRRLLLCSLLILLTACSFPGVQPDLLPSSRSSTPPAGSVPDSVLPPVTPTAAAPPLPPTPTPAPPAGWSTLESAELGLSLYLPPGWEAASAGRQLDVHETDGEGWIEIRVLDDETDAEWGFDYRSGSSPDDLIEVLLSGLRENGDFEDARLLQTRGGQSASFSTGTYQVFNERLLVGVVAFPDRAAVLLGHSSEGVTDPDGPWARLALLYEQVLASIIPLPG